MTPPGIEPVACVADVGGGQADSGHNLSLGVTAAACHLKVLSFVEECAVARESAGVELEAS
jgi:hypothetical protein